MQYLIWLTTTAALPPEKAWALLARFGSGKAVFEAETDELSRVLLLTPAEKQRLKKRDLAPAQRILADCRRQGIHILSIVDEHYPQRLKAIYDPPLILYVRGELPELNDLPAIAVVGTRRCTPYGAVTAEKLAFGLSQNGVVVISGMAEGVDSAAHRGALKGGTPTIAVFGTAIDGCYPAINGGLLRDILRHGAAVSEYPPGAKTGRGGFPRRNRIMSGLSLGVAVAEAPDKSGALITAGLALDQGRDVFAVPGGVDAPGSAGANELIQRGAKLIRNAEDILCEYRGVYRLSPPAQAAPVIREPVASVYAAASKSGAISTPAPASTDDPLLAALCGGPLPLEELTVRTGLSSSDLLAKLTVLELKGRVRQLPGKLFERL
ncbi:MAG: DNA-processing protein DprA [Clostridiaceae bacterium]|nr:DNA-processing protein DprA [Clostridiaceae bacterium]